MRKIKIGDTVLWRGSFGSARATKAKVVGIEQMPKPRQKYDGKQVDEVDVSMKNFCVFELDNEHWCYGDQIQTT